MLITSGICHKSKNYKVVKYTKKIVVKTYFPFPVIFEFLNILGSCNTEATFNVDLRISCRKINAVNVICFVHENVGICGYY